MSGGQAESLLQAKGEPWTFLVRESLSQPGDFVLSVLNDQPKAGPGSPLKVTHIKVMCEVSQLGRGGGGDGGKASCQNFIRSCWEGLLGLDLRLGVPGGGLGPEGWPDLVSFRVDAIPWVARRPLTASQTWWSTSRRQGSRRPQVPLSTCGR